MNDFRRAFTEAVNTEDLFRLAMEQDLQRTHAHSHDLRPRQMFKLGTTHLVRHLHGCQLLLGFADRTDFRNGVDARRDIFNQMRRRFTFHQRLCGDAALIVSGGGQAWVTNHVAHRVNVRQRSLVHAVDLELTAAVGFKPDILQLQ